MTEEIDVANRTIMISGFIHAGVTAEWKKQIEEMQTQDPHRPISLYFNSLGGEAEATFDFYHFLRKVDSEGTPLIGIVIGECKSGAAVILLACRHREAFANAAFLIHYPILVVAGDPRELITDPLFRQKLAESAADSVQVLAQIESVTLEKTSLNALEFKLLAISGRIFGAFEALRFGLIHRIC